MFAHLHLLCVSVYVFTCLSGVCVCVCVHARNAPNKFRRCLDILSGLFTFDQTLIYFDSEHKQLCPQIDQKMSGVCMLL